VTAPAGANVNPTNGLFSWRPAIAQAPSTNPVVLTVTDSGVPPLIATQSFWITVTVPARPTLSAAALSNRQFRMTIAGNSGPDYTILASTNLTDWLPIWVTNSPTPPFVFFDPEATNLNGRFYRVRLGP
jgi:hypothetical protein